MGKICCFTGHRDIGSKYAHKLYALLKESITLLANEGFTEFRSGGAQGFDTLAALAVLEVKATMPHIKLELILPCLDQDKFWSKDAKLFYEYTKKRADAVYYVRRSYYNGIMHERDRRLVDGSDMCISFLAKTDGGTAYTCNYAKRKKVPILNLFQKLK